MTTEDFIIREIQQKDNQEIAQVIRSVLVEFGAPKIGTAYEDKETTMMYESYRAEKEIYFVVEVDGEILGGAGIKHLKNFEEDVCELQKMYFSSKIRGKGYGKLIFEKCLQSAKEIGYNKCYLESASILKTAIHIYEKYRFKHLEKPLGSTGHYSCGVWMIKEL